MLKASTFSICSRRLRPIKKMLLLDEKPGYWFELSVIEWTYALP